MGNTRDLHEENIKWWKQEYKKRMQDGLILACRTIKEEIMKKSIITVVGKDTVGIIAKVCTYLAENAINILDISQTIVQDYFTMMMIVDMNNSQKSFDVVSDELAQLGVEIGVVVKCQREEIFDSMHRI